MSSLIRFLAGAGLLCMAAAAVADAPAINWELDDAIRQIDRQADNFDTAMARVSFVFTDAEGTVVNRHEGNGFINRKGDMRYSQDGGDRILVVDGNTVSDYDGGAGTVQEHSLYRDKGRLESFYRLGFSISGRDMKDRYLVTILGEEEIGEARTLVLELTPKRDKERAVVGKVTLWIDQASWMPRRQEFNSTADRSTTTLNYTGMARNLRLKPELFKAKWPKGTKKVKG